jgi:hypothetical protein
MPSMDAQPLRISLFEDISGQEVTPDRVPLAVLREFTADVEAFVRGKDKEIDTSALQVAVVKGSLAIHTEPLANPGLMRDLLRLADSQLIDSLDERRRDVVARWQKVARGRRNLRIELATSWLVKPVVIHARSDFHADDANQWVRVERYLRGEIVDLGGKGVTNAHVVLPDGKMLTVEAPRDLIQADTVNRLYKQAMVRIRGEYNVATREYRNVHLVEFVEHNNRLDAQALARLTERGAVAWKDVPNASEWVDGLRGGES